jgi:hypothetical protein
MNRLYDVYVYHNLFNPGFHMSYYIPSSKRAYNSKKFNSDDVSGTHGHTNNPLTISFNDQSLLNSDLYDGEENNAANLNGKCVSS